MKPKLYDLCSGAGGCTKGYQEAGFYVVGVDIEAQKNYIGDEFIQMCAMEFLKRYLNGEYPEADAFSASPPCQGYSKSKHLSSGKHPMMIGQIRKLLQATGKPYIIENVPGAPLINPVWLTGTMFGLMTHKSRLFECSFDVPFMLAPPPSARQCKMGRQPKPGEYIQVVGHFTDTEYAKMAIGIDWMNRDELAQAIPPAFTCWLGQRLLETMAVNA